MKRGTTIPKSKNFIKIWLLGFAFMLVIFNSSVTLALDPLGPPIATLEAGQFSLGLDYSRSSMDSQLINGKWTDSTYGSFEGAGKSISLTLEDFEQSSSYVNFGYGIDYGWEAFIRLNYTKAEFSNSLTPKGDKFESDSVPAFGGGIKATFYETEDLIIGGIAQANMVHYNGQRNVSDWYLPDFVETDIIEIQFTMGASYMLIDGIWIYGGPIIHFINGEFTNISITEAETGGLTLTEYTWDIEEDSMYGGYIGTQLDLGDYYSLSIEYQLTGSANALGAGFVMRF